MNDLPNNWDQLESEYYLHHDPYDIEVYCEECEAEKSDLCVCEPEKK